MSVQLIVYPQSYDGQFNSITTTSNEFVVDGSLFSTMNTSGTYDSSASNAIVDSLTNAAPSLFNTWYRFRTTSSGTPTIPTELSGNLTLLSVPTLTLSGVYQKLSNLVSGTTYEMVIDLSTTGTGLVLTSAYNGTTQITQTSYAASQSQITHTWTAQTTNDTIVISYYNTTTDNIAISNISVSEQGVTPTATFTDLQDGQVICDLYEDEDIPLSLSVDNFKNVAEKVQSYSKAFNLPATKRNNQIFDNIFEITRTDTGLNFNPYKRTKAVLKQDGFLLFEGYLRMIDISDKSGEISYNVNLYSEAVALADVLGDKTFSDLDFSELEHNYNLTNIQATWGATGVTYLNASTSGFRSADTVKYPFVDWTHQFTADVSSGFPVLPTLESAFRPFLHIKYLLDMIFAPTDFTYESSFFNTADFDNLYMDFNWGADNAPVVFSSSGALTNLSDASIGTSYATLNFDQMATVNGTILGANMGYSSGVFTAQEDGQVYNFAYSMVFNRGVVSDTLEVQWLVNGVSVDFATTSFSSFPYTGNFTTPPLSAGDTVLCQAKCSSGQYDLDGVVAFPVSLTPSLVTITTSVNQTTTDTLLGTLRGELGQWNFIKGIMTMFNLVTLPDENNPSNIKIEPYADIFINNSDSTELDWTEKIDVTEMKLMPLTDLNKKTIFKFVEDESDYAFMNYRNSIGGHLYGSKKYDASEFTILAGEDEIIAEPFAATVVKPLMSQFSDFITPAVYSLAEDGTSEGFENSPRIMYDNGEKTLTSCTYYIPPQNGVGGSAFEDEFLQFSHLTSLPPGAIATDRRDFHFGQCQLIPPVGASVPNNLFNLYWLPYYSELYNPDTRIMTTKVNLNPSDINTFRFFDTVMIKNKTYRVNKIEYKPNDLAIVEFILIP